MSQLLTVNEVAQFLRINAKHVKRMLDNGQIRGFKVARKWRVLEEDFLAFLKNRLEDQQKAILEEYVQDPKNWAKLVLKDDEMLKRIESETFPKGSFGEWLQKGLDSLG